MNRFDRNKWPATLSVLIGFATLACTLAPTRETLMLAGIVAGAFGAVLRAPAQTIVADVIRYERRCWAMGIVMSSFSLASSAGVPFGLFLAAHFEWPPCSLPAGLAD